MTTMQIMMTQDPLDTAANSLCCAFIYMKDRTDLTPEERAALEAAKAAADVFHMMVFDRIVRPALAGRGQTEVEG